MLNGQTIGEATKPCTTHFQAPSGNPPYGIRAAPLLLEAAGCTPPPPCVLTLTALHTYDELAFRFRPPSPLEHIEADPAELQELPGDSLPSGSFWWGKP